ncbi:MAG: FAD-binding oxidoreductase, partial [Azospirillaceae bacterium]
RALTRASHGFLKAPPAGFASAPLLKPRGVVLLAGAAEADRFHAEVAGDPALEEVAIEDVRAMVPPLRPDAYAFAAFERGATEIDVAALHQGFLAGFKALGGRVALDAGVTRIERRSGRWHIAAGAHAFEADVIVNAAGAWSDRVAALAGARPVGLVPKRRTAVILPPPEGADPAGWPVVGDFAETFYFKPETGNLLASPADATPSDPCDAQPEELDVALVVDRIETVLGYQVRRVLHRWAGLRTFAPDGNPVIGWDPAVEGFFWLAGQGGYGIQTAAGMARLTAAEIAGGPAPIAGLDTAAVSPARFAAAA